MAKFILGAAAFARALAQVVPVIVNNPVVPILENVLLEAEQTKSGWLLRLTCSDLETTLQAVLPVECREEFRLCVPAKRLLDTLKALPDQPVTCSVDIESYRFGLTASRSRYTLAGENAADYPSRPVVKAGAQRYGIAADKLRAALATTLPTVSTDTLRPAMCGVFVEKLAGEIVRLASTDGHRMNQYTLVPGSAEPGFIIPTRPAGLLLPVLEASGSESVQLLIDGNSIRLEDGRWASSVIDDRYPEYQNIIPLRQPNTAIVDRDELLNAFRRLSQFVDGKYRAAVLSFTPSEIHITAENDDEAQDGSETITCTYQGEDLTLGMNCPWAIGQLRLMPQGPLRIGMSTPNRAWVVTADADQPSLLCLCMPVFFNVAA
jgi:DNA polymerase-3 subunit beta